MGNVALVVMTLVCVLFWAPIALEYLPWPGGLFAALGIVAAPAFVWWVQFRGARRTTMLASPMYLKIPPKRVFGKAAGLSFLVVFAFIVVCSLNLTMDFLPDWLGLLPALVVFNPFVGWAVLLIPLIIGGAFQMVASTAPPPRNIHQYGELPPQPGYRKPGRSFWVGAGRGLIVSGVLLAIGAVALHFTYPDAVGEATSLVTEVLWPFFLVFVPLVGGVIGLIAAAIRRGRNPIDRPRSSIYQPRTGK